MKKLVVKIATSPHARLHADRGIGTYTRFLIEALEQEPGLELIKPGQDGRLPFGKFGPDIVHYPFFDLFFPTLPFYWWTPLVVTIHDLIPLVFPDQYPPGRRGKLNLYRQRLALKLARAVITDSTNSQTDIVDFLNIPKEKILVVPLAANPGLGKASPKQVRRVKSKYHLPKNYILYVGDINYNKNVPALIKALKFLPKNVHLVAVGKNFVPQEIPEWQWIETQVALSDVEARVHFVTDVLTDATDELSAFYTGALCYVQPSLYEGFGLPVLEAMAGRTPVVSAETSSLVEVGGDHALYAQPTAESLAEQINEVLGWSKTARLNWVRRAYRWSQTFSWQQTARATAAVYRSVAG